MTPLGYVAIATAVCVAAAMAASLIMRRRRGPLTQREQLAAARRASRSIRRITRKPDHDTFERGSGVPDRHSAAIAENSVYGDSAGL